MTQPMIDEMVAAFASAAGRVQEGGLDGVEVHFAHGYLIGQFLSPLTNHRTDGYGGSFENRLRFGMEVVQAVRAVVGHGYVVGVRLSGSEGVPGGLTPEDTKRIAQALEATGQIDFFDLSTAGYFNLDRIVAGMHEPHAYQLPETTPTTRAVSAPTIVVGRFKTLEEADAVIASGQADMVSMVRATIADPDLVNKTREGRVSEVRPCIGCNQGCIGGWTGPLGRFGCAVNVGAGRELHLGDDRLVPAITSRKVLVAGGGPAGLEAARVAALRGHRVTLYEASGQLGGQVVAARLAPYRQEFGESTDWLEREVRRLEVEVVLGTRVDRELVERVRPDAVIIATGSVPRGDGLQAESPERPVPGADLPHVYASSQVLSGDAPVPASALVLDDVGHYEAIGVAEYLLEHGARVTFVTRHVTLGTLLVAAGMQGPALQRLTDHHPGFTLMPRTQVTEIVPATVRTRSLDSGVEHLVEAELVVLVTRNRSEYALVTELAGLPCEVHLVGDARAPRPLEMAIHEGHHAALKV